MKHKPAHTDAAFLADQIDAIATLMWALSERMEYYAGFNGKMNLHAREMAGASSIARTWSSAIRAQIPTANPHSRRRKGTTP